MLNIKQRLNKVNTVNIMNMQMDGTHKKTFHKCMNAIAQHREHACQ